MTCLRCSTAAVAQVDVAVVGAGIVGLAHALAAHRRGLSVLVIDRDARAVGASLRNFGHLCFTAQAGQALGFATVSREIWLDVAARSGLWLNRAGTLVLARADDELAVLNEFAQARPGEVELLTAAEVDRQVHASGAVLGGALLPNDLRVDPRTAVRHIANWLAEQGVRFAWSTNVRSVECGRVATTRGDVAASRVIVAVGHDIDRLFPDIASGAKMRRCLLRMLSVAAPHDRPIEPAVFTGFSLARYDGFADSPSIGRLRRRLAEQYPRLVARGLNLMLTQRPDGALIIGDTHDYATTHEPFDDAASDEVILDEIAGLLGVDRLQPLERWRGEYASAPEPFLIAAPEPGVRVVSVTSGIGMTTSFGLADEVVAELMTE